MAGGPAGGPPAWARVVLYATAPSSRSSRPALRLDDHLFKQNPDLYSRTTTRSSSTGRRRWTTSAYSSNGTAFRTFARNTLIVSVAGRDHPDRRGAGGLQPGPARRRWGGAWASPSSSSTWCRRRCCSSRSRGWWPPGPAGLLVGDGARLPHVHHPRLDLAAHGLLQVDPAGYRRAGDGRWLQPARRHLAHGAARFDPGPAVVVFSAHHARTSSSMPWPSCPDQPEDDLRRRDHRADPRRCLLLAVPDGGRPLVAIPLALMYNLFLDRFIAGFTLGAVKG